ncbi:protein kinase, partial [candidate division GN15 bacterium]|nr:protein kinase [candidate division GN15 bacterium]
PGRSIAQDSDVQPLFYSDVLYIADQAAAALTSAQSEEITLGNITPANIIVDDVRHIRLVDCCLPRPSPGKTVDSYELSDMRYRAPEQLEGGEVTPASDIFALGLVFYELLTGVYPIEADTVESYRERLTTEPLDFNSIASQRIPTDAHLLLESMCAIDPAERISSLSLLASLQEMHDQHEAQIVHVGDELDDGPHHNPRRLLVLSLIAALLVVFWFVITVIER